MYYKKYRGAQLSEKGRGMALSIIRRHRLWEVFLYQVLGFRGDKVHELAEEMEHLRDEELIDRLDRFLDYPRYDPHGASIPTADGHIGKDKRYLLSSLPKGSKGRIVGLKHQTPELTSYLKSKKLNVGQGIEVEAIESYDQSMTLRIEGDPELAFISYQAARNVYISS